MNNAIKLKSCEREYRVDVKELLRDVFSTVLLLAEFAIYGIMYAIYEIKTCLRTDTAKGVAVFYKRFVRIWLYSFLLCAMAFNYGTFAIGLVCVSISVPVCTICTLLAGLPKIEK